MSIGTSCGSAGEDRLKSASASSPVLREGKNMKRFLFMSFILIFGMGLSSPSEGASDKPKRGGTLTMAIAKDIVLMNPLVATRSTEQAIRELMFEPLVGIDLKGNLQPSLAERWESSKD